MTERQNADAVRCPIFHPEWAVKCKLEAGHGDLHQWWGGDDESLHPVAWRLIDGSATDSSCGMTE